MATDEELHVSHSPRFVGRAIGNVAKRSGRASKVGELGSDYGFTDIDGRQPGPFKLPENDG